MTAHLCWVGHERNLIKTERLDPRRLSQLERGEERWIIRKNQPSAHGNAPQALRELCLDMTVAEISAAAAMSSLLWARRVTVGDGSNMSLSPLR
jgi:hypothetical protein